MKGMIVKDILALKKSCPVIALFFIVYMYISFMGGDFSLMYIFPLLMSAFIIGTINEDVKSHWNIYSIGLPCEKKHYVASKYILCLLSAVLSSAMLMISFSIFLAVRHEFEMKEILSLSLTSVAISMFYPIVSCPFIFLFNSDYGKLISMSVIGAVGGAGCVFLGERLEGAVLVNINILIPLAITFVAYGISWYISTVIYNKKSL